jgi:predicted ATPase
MRAELPVGTVTFLFTDIEGSTRLIEALGEDGYVDALGEHQRVLRTAFGAHGGVEVGTQGDAFLYAFTDPGDGLAAAAQGQKALASGPVRVRMGLHTGHVRLTREGDDYTGREVHRAARIAAAGHGGQVVVSAATRLLVESQLTLLGEHRLKDFDDPVALYQLGSRRFPPLKTISNTNLPRPASSFVGRQRERDEVIALLSNGTRLLTLSGPGGSGKTRLAVEAATELVSRFGGGVFWVALAQLRDATLVLETISQTLGARDGLEEHIGERQLLLLLDNLEQVIEAAPQVSGLLESCPNLRLLCTSRELLRVHGEVEYQVRPLASAEAVALFCERSGLDSTAEIAQLCDRLDDLPLAVELAAARTRALTPGQILERLSQRLDLLHGGRDADPRQQTLRATIAWSHDLLSEQERLLFRALSVFAGGCTLEAAEEVAGAELDTLQSLIEKSLLRFTNERYWMLEMVRDYALEQLDESANTEALRDHHAHYFVSQLEQRWPDIRGTQRAKLLAWFDDEEANLRAAVDRLAQSALPDAARAADHLVQLWSARGQLQEGRERLEALLTHDGLVAETRAMLLTHLANIEERMGDLGAAESHAHEVLRLSEEAGVSGQSAVHAVHTLGYVAILRGDYEQARRWADRMLAEAGDDETLRALALGNVANLELEAGSELEARRALLEAIQADRAAGAAWSEVINILNLGWLELYAHDFEATCRLAQSAIEKLPGEDYYHTLAAFQTLGFALVGLGRRSEARDAFAKSLDLTLTSGMTGGALLIEQLFGIAYAAERERFDSAAQLLGAARRLGEEIERHDPRKDELGQFLAQPIIDGLGAERYASERALGAPMTREQAVELAQSLVERDV